MRPLLDVFIDQSCELRGNPLLSPLNVTSLDVLRDAEKLNAGGVLLLGARATDDASSLRVLAELRRKNPYVIVYLCVRWDRVTLERMPRYVRAGVDEMFTISGERDVLDLVEVVSRRILAPPPISTLMSIASQEFESRPLRFALHAFRNSQFAVALEEMAERWGYRLRTIEDFVEKAALPSARDLFRCGRYAHEGELKRRAVTSATERALRLGFDSATDLRKWKWRLRESAKSDARLLRFAEQIDGLDALRADGRDW